MSILVYCTEDDPNDEDYGEHDKLPQQVYRVPSAPGSFRCAAQIIVGAMLLPDPLLMPASITLQPLPAEISTTTEIEFELAEMYYNAGKYCYVAAIISAGQKTTLVADRPIVARVRPLITIGNDVLTRPRGRLVFEFLQISCYLLEKPRNLS